MIINHSNIVYVRDITEIGGVETWAYELAKKYHDLDLAIVVKNIDQKQLERLAKLVPVYKHNKEKIECDVAVINYDTSIIPYIDAKVGIYQTIHGDYENPAYSWESPTHPKIKEYLCITKYLINSVKRITGNTNLRLCYNPLTIEDGKKPLILISATRLSAIKGKDRMQKLATALDKAGVEYVWIVFTNDTNAIKSPNVVFIPPKLDIGRWSEVADYVVQLSDTEACSYAIAEALFRNTPIISTPLPYLEEIGVKDGVNSYILEFDCSNMDSIVKRITTVPKFTFKKWEDDYSNIFTREKGSFSPDKVVKFKVKISYKDLILNRVLPVGYTMEIPMERANYLRTMGLGNVIEEGK